MEFCVPHHIKFLKGIWEKKEKQVKQNIFVPCSYFANGDRDFFF